MEKSKETDSKRYTTHRIKRSYEYASHDADGNFNGLTVKDWKEQILTEWSPAKLGADSVCIIFHDKDKDEEGNPKGLHVHGVAHYQNKDRRTSSSVCRLSQCFREADCRPADKPVDAYRYLLHVTEKAINEGKHIYDEDEVIVMTADGVSFDYRKAITRAKEKKDRIAAEDAVSGLLHRVSIGELTLGEVKDMYQSDAEGLGFSRKQWYKDKRMYEEAEKEYFSAMHNWHKYHKRCLTGIYIQGPGESRKSENAMSIARHYSDRRGYHVAPAPGKSTTYDPVGKYHGEKVSIFNEVDGGAFTIEQFTDMFDPIHASEVNSRNVDKPWFPSMFIFTNSVPLEDFIANMMGDPLWHDRHSDNKVHQIRRRFALNIVCKEYTKEHYTDDGGCYAEQVKYLEIYVRDAHVKCEVTHPAYEEPFKFFAAVYPDIVGESLTLKVIDRAIEAYYCMSGYSVTPWTVEEPKLEATEATAEAADVQTGLAWTPEEESPQR